MMPENHSDTIGEFLVTTVVNTPPWYENCYVVQHRPSGRHLVIDPGGEAKRIAAVVQAGGGTAAGILLTHGHPDHLGGVHDLQEAFDISCHAHEQERVIVASLPDWGRMMQRRLNPPQKLDYFTDEPVLDYGDFSVRVLFTPGHTPGGVCYVFDGFVFTGDTLFNQGVGRTDLPGGNGQALVGSITRLLRDLAPATRLYSGHGPDWTVAEASQWWEWAASHGYA